MPKAARVLLLHIFWLCLAQTMENFKRVSTQFIAADPGMLQGKESSGTGADHWGIWRIDPGPRGVRLSDFPRLLARDGVAPRGGWQFDKGDWWLEEHGLIMEKPHFPLPVGRYRVTGGRETTATLTVLPDFTWELDGGATLHDVTHLPCRSARYRPESDAASPANANPAEFPVTPGAEMPVVEGCSKQDYAVVFVTAIEDVKQEL